MSCIWYIANAAVDTSALSALHLHVTILALTEICFLAQDSEKLMKFNESEWCSRTPKTQSNVTLLNVKGSGRSGLVRSGAAQVKIRERNTLAGLLHSAAR